MVSAIVMVGDEPHHSAPTDWVQGARRAAAHDLITQLARQPQIDRIILVSPAAGSLISAGATDYVQSDRATPHMGRRLGELADRFHLPKLLYFGGASAPLLTDSELAGVISRLDASQRLVITNNQFASDWAGIAPADIVREKEARLPRDNMIGWVLSTEAQLPIHTLPASASSRLDIDTPTDLLTLRLHPDTKPFLRAYLERLPLEVDRLEQALQVLARPAGRIFVAGRLGPQVWAAINRVSHCWLRVVSEERGMVSSGRQERGEARSILAAYIALAGMENFFQTLAGWADAAFIDTRVLLAHHNEWPDEETRFASDLGLLDTIAGGWLREFTVHASRCAIPIVLGGHGLLSGDMFALCDILASWRMASDEW